MGYLVIVELRIFDGIVRVAFIAIVQIQNHHDPLWYIGVGYSHLLSLLNHSTIYLIALLHKNKNIGFNTSKIKYKHFYMSELKEVIFLAATRTNN